MNSIRTVGGVLLLILAALKIIALASILMTGDESRTTQWMIKQSVYAVAAAYGGFSLLRSK